MGFNINASLVMPLGDLRDRFFYPTLTIMMDTYILSQGKIPISLSDEQEKLFLLL